jgi:hypothetical protein
MKLKIQTQNLFNIMKVIPKDQIQKIKASRSNRQNSRLNWGFLQNGISRDLKIERDFSRGITLDVSQGVPATFSQRKSHSKRFQIKNHEIMLMNQIEKRKEKKGGKNMGIKTCSKEDDIHSTKKDTRSWNPRGTHLYKRSRVQVLILHKNLKQREGKKEERGAAALAHENLP